VKSFEEFLSVVGENEYDCFLLKNDEPNHTIEVFYRLSFKQNNVSYRQSIKFESIARDFKDVVRVALGPKVRE